LRAGDLLKLLAETRRYEEISRTEQKQKLIVTSAYDGLEIIL